MPLVKNEQEEKRESTFLKYEAENTLIIKSNLYKVVSHYIKSLNKFVACHKENCIYCQKGFQKKSEYNYFVKLNNVDGIMDIKPSVFFSINAIEKISKKDKRAMSWLVIKTGSGLDTEYTASKDETLKETQSEKELLDLNAKLEGLMTARELKLEEDYEALKNQVGEVKTKTEEPPLPEEEN